MSIKLPSHKGMLPFQAPSTPPSSELMHVKEELPSMVNPSSHMNVHVLPYSLLPLHEMLALSGGVST